MSQLTDNLYSIDAIKSDIKSAIEAKGVDMTGLSFPDYPAAIGSITTSFVTTTLSTSVNGTFTPGVGVDGYSQVVVDVPQSVTGFTEKDVTEGIQITDLNNSASYVHSFVYEKDTYLQTVNLPNCTIVNENAFANCSNLTTVSLPVCTSIGSYAFQYCSSLTQVSLPLCRYIGSYAFNISGQFVSELNLPICINMGNNAFYRCYSLAQVSLPVCISIGNNAFNDCSSLNSLTLCTDVYWTIPYQGNMLSRTPIMSGTGSIYVRSDTYSAWITSTGWSSLSDRFVSVETSGIAISFSEGTVYGTTKALNNNLVSYLGISKSDITKVSLPECNYLMSSALTYMTLNSVYLPECIEVYNNVFESTSISSIDLPKCKEVQYRAFYNCKSTHNINLPQCEYIGDGGFFACFSLESIDLPLCSYIGNNVFNMCYALSEVNLPICEYVGDSAFNTCVLSSLNLPVCSYIGAYAFANMYSTFKTLVLGYSSIVTTAEQGVFINVEPSIFVPASLVDAYKSAEYWSAYSSKIFPIPEP